MKGYLFIILFLFIISFSQKQVTASNSFIVVGHLYEVIENKKIMDSLFKKFDEIDPDFIFILGDSSLHKEKHYNLFKNRFKDNIFFSPGNNEVQNENLNNYKKNVGYLNKILIKDNLKFIILDSNDDIINIKKFLKENITKNNNFKQIIMTHHRIWDDTLTSKKPFQHDKSFYFKEIFSLLNNSVDAIFAGNSKRQFFSDNSSMNVPQNFNNIYWVDQVGDIDCYSVGTGDGYPKLGFVYVEEIENKLFIKPYHVLTSSKDPIPIKDLRIHPNSEKPQ